MFMTSDLLHSFLGSRSGDGSELGYLLKGRNATKLKNSNDDEMFMEIQYHLLFVMLQNLT